MATDALADGPSILADPKVRFGLTIAVIVVMPGLTTALLASAGYDDAASLAWMVGYGAGVIFVWARWLRPIDIRGPDAPEE